MKGFSDDPSWRADGEVSAPSEAGPPPGWREMPGADVDPFQRLNGPFYVADPFEPTELEPLRLGFRISPHNCSYSGYAHGGWLSAILDVSLGQSVHHGCGVQYAPTISLVVDFLQGGKVGDWLESRTRLLRVTRSVAFCDGLLIGPGGTVARANGVFKLPSNRPIA